MDRRSFLASAAVTFSSSVCSPFVLKSSTSAWAAEGISLIVPGPGGSRSGVAGRILAGALQKELAVPVEVVAVDSPREGYLMVAGAAGNGSTFGLIGADMPALNRGIGGSPGVGSVVPVALLSEDPAGIHVRRDAPWRSAGDVVASLRSGPARLRASGAGRHAVWHLSAQRWLAAAKAGSIDWQAAANPAAAAEELTAGGPDVVVCSVPEVRATPQAKGIRTLAVMASRRNGRYPEIATLAEAGVGVRAGWWRGVAAPRGISPQNVARMQAALQRVHASPAYRSEMARRGFALSWAGSAEFGQFIAREDRAVAVAIQAIGTG